MRTYLRILPTAWLAPEKLPLQGTNFELFSEVYPHTVVSGTEDSYTHISSHPDRQEAYENLVNAIEPYQRGQLAREEGVEASRNPFIPGTKDYNEFAIGYQQANVSTRHSVIYVQKLVKNFRVHRVFGNGPASVKVHQTLTVQDMMLMKQPSLHWKIEFRPAEQLAYDFKRAYRERQDDLAVEAYNI